MYSNKDIPLSRANLKKAVNKTYFDFYWDDIRTEPITAYHGGARAPMMETVASDGEVGEDYAVDFQGGHGYIADYAGLDSTDEYTVEMWVNPTNPISDTLWWRDGFLEIEIRYGRVVVSIDNSWHLYSQTALQGGQTQHVAVTVNYNDNRSYVHIYVNGNEVGYGAMYGYQLAASSNPVYIASKPDGSRTYEGIMDSLVMYNVELSEAQVIERYNAGEGTASLPTGVTEATDVVGLFLFDEGTGSTVDNSCTLGAGYDMSLNSTYSWVTGLLGITTGSIGVQALSFPAGAITEIFGSVQFPHSYKEGSLIYPHVHWAAPNTDAGDVVWKLEYLWVNIHENMQPNTTLVSTTVANEVTTLGMHKMTNVPAAGIDGTGMGISSILQYRLYRDGLDANDTYPGKVYVSEFDIHFTIDAFGSEYPTTHEAPTGYAK